MGSAWGLGVLNSTAAFERLGIRGESETRGPDGAGCSQQSATARQGGREAGRQGGCVSQMPSLGMFKPWLL